QNLKNVLDRLEEVKPGPIVCQAIDFEVVAQSVNQLNLLNGWGLSGDQVKEAEQNLPKLGAMSGSLQILTKRKIAGAAALETKSEDVAREIHRGVTDQLQKYHTALELLLGGKITLGDPNANQGGGFGPNGPNGPGPMGPGAAGTGSGYGPTSPRPPG